MVGTVTAINFTTSGPLLTVSTTGGAVMTDVRLAQVSLVRL